MSRLAPEDRLHPTIRPDRSGINVDISLLFACGTLRRARSYARRLRLAAGSIPVVGVVKLVSLPFRFPRPGGLVTPPVETSGPLRPSEAPFMSRPSIVALHRATPRGVECRVPVPPVVGPASPVAVLRFALPKATTATLSVHSADGRVVRTLLNGTLEAGEHDCRWDGRDDLGRSVPAGNYCLQLEAGGSPLTSRRVTVR